MMKIKFGHVMDAIMDLIANLYFINLTFLTYKTIRL
jgi:hypothetical protein